MNHAVFRAWLAEIDDLTAQQRQEVASALAGPSSLKAVTAAIEDRLGGERVCPHCGCSRSSGVVVPIACSGTAARIAGSPSTL